MAKKYRAETYRLRAFRVKRGEIVIRPHTLGATTGRSVSAESVSYRRQVTLCAIFPIPHRRHNSSEADFLRKCCPGHGVNLYKLHKRLRSFQKRINPDIGPNLILNGTCGAASLDLRTAPANELRVCHFSFGELGHDALSSSPTMSPRSTRAPFLPAPRNFLI